MDGVVAVVKRWWVLVLVFALALSLTSCAKKKAKTVANYGYTQCDGTMGAFDAYVIPSKFDVTKYEVSIVPIQLDVAGDIATITVANTSLMYKTMQTEIVLNNNSPIFAGYLDSSEVETYDTLAILPYEPGVPFLEADPEKATICTLPLPGESNPASAGYAPSAGTGDTGGYAQSEPPPVQ